MDHIAQYCARGAEAGQVFAALTLSTAFFFNRMCSLSQLSPAARGGILQRRISRAATSSEL